MFLFAQYINDMIVNMLKKRVRGMLLSFFFTIEIMNAIIYTDVILWDLYYL